jgi:FtsZ-binding cell division protein ZapB
MKTDSFAAERRKFERLSKERTDQDKTIGVLRTAIDGLKEKLFKVESEKDNIKESSNKNNLKESAEVAGVKKELAGLKTKVGIITQSRDKAQTRNYHS